MGPHRRSRSGDDGDSGSQAPEAEWVLARPRDGSKTLQRKLCRLFIDGGGRWRAGGVTEVSPGQDRTVGKGGKRRSRERELRGR